MNIKIRDISVIALFTAIIAVLAQIVIPMPYGVPMTMQTFGIALAGVILGAKRGTIAVLLYVLIGAIGVPVFAGLTGGIGKVLGSTGGFILSFPIMAYLSGFGQEKGNKYWLSAGLFLGMFVNFACGMLMFMFITKSDFYIAFIGCVLPFIFTGTIKCIIAGSIGLKIKNILVKRRLLI